MDIGINTKTTTNTIKFPLLKPLRKLARFSITTGLLISPIIYFNESANHYWTCSKRFYIALYYEGKVFLNYKLQGFSEDTHDYAAKTLAKLFSINQGPALKLGQNLAQHNQILPKPFEKHMQPFMQACPITPYKDIKKLIEKELKKDLFEIFEYFEEDPIASASIAQVHKARLKDTGEIVAVKVQHPSIINQVKADIKIVEISCKLANYFFPLAKVSWIDKDFRTNMVKEVDFNKEKDNIKKCRKLFKYNRRVIVPKVYDSYSSTRVLTMSYEQGKPITDVEYRIKNKIKVEEISYLLTNTFYKQIFDYGFVHSDPHQGNLFIRKERLSHNNPKVVTKLVILDHGLYMNLEKDFIRSYSMLWRGIFNQNVDQISEAALKLGIDNTKVFVSMLTGRNFNEVMDSDNKYDTKIRLHMKKVNPEKVRKWMDENYTEMLRIFEEGPPELPLLFKITDYLRAIDNKIGKPIDNYTVLVSMYY